MNYASSFIPTLPSFLNVVIKVSKFSINLGLSSNDNSIIFTYQYIIQIKKHLNFYNFLLYQVNYQSQLNMNSPLTVPFPVQFPIPLFHEISFVSIFSLSPGIIFFLNLRLSAETR